MDGVSESGYWGMVWKTNAVKIELTALHTFILEMAEDGTLNDSQKQQYKNICDTQETLAHERLKKKMKRMGITGS